MRIALFHDLASGGAKRSVFEVTRLLAVRHKIDCYTLSSANHTFCDLSPYVDDYHIFDFESFPLFNSPFGRLNQLQRWRGLRRLEEVCRTIALRIDQGG